MVQCQSFDGIGRQGTIVFGEVMYGLQAISCDEVEPVVERAYPLAVGCVDGEAGGVHPIEQVVGIVGTIVAGYLDLGEVVVVVEGFRGVVQHVGTCIGHHPEVAVRVFGNIVDIVNLGRLSVLVYKLLGECLDAVIGRVVQCAVQVYAVEAGIVAHIHYPHPSTTVK